jgi:hypothetical protein
MGKRSLSEYTLQSILAGSLTVRRTHPTSQRATFAYLDSSLACQKWEQGNKCKCPLANEGVLSPACKVRRTGRKNYVPAMMHDGSLLVRVGDSEGSQLQAGYPLFTWRRTCHSLPKTLPR